GPGLAPRPTAGEGALLAQLLQLGPVCGELLALGLDDFARGVGDEPLVAELVLGAVDLGAQRLSALLQSPADLARVDVAPRHDLDRSEVRQGLAVGAVE